MVLVYLWYRSLIENGCGICVEFSEAWYAYDCEVLAAGVSLVSVVVEHSLKRHYMRAFAFRDDLVPCATVAMTAS